jgi:hypothetical protein
MTRIASRAAAMLALLLPTVAGSSAQPAPDPQGSQIEIDYVEPANPEFKPIRERLQQRQVLEQLQIFLSPLQLPRKLAVKTDQCGANTLPYRSGGPVTICYEYIADIERVTPKQPYVIVGAGYLSRDQLIVGPVVMVVFHEVALALFDSLEVPMWGMEEDAADRLAGFIMTQFGWDVAWKTLMGSAWYLAQTGISGGGLDFSMTRNIGGRRFYNYLCMAYGSAEAGIYGREGRARFEFLAKRLNIPSNRRDWCINDYIAVRQAFTETILPHVDQELLKKVRAMRWLGASAPQ